MNEGDIPIFTQFKSKSLPPFVLNYPTGFNIVFSIGQSDSRGRLICVVRAFIHTVEEI